MSRECLWHPSDGTWEEHGRVRVSDSTTRRVRDSATNDAEDGNRPPWVGNSVVAIELITGNSPGLVGFVVGSGLPQGRTGASEPGTITLHVLLSDLCLRAGRNAAHFFRGASGVGQLKVHDDGDLGLIGAKTLHVASDVAVDDEIICRCPLNPGNALPGGATAGTSGAPDGGNIETGAMASATPCFAYVLWAESAGNVQSPPVSYTHLTLPTSDLV